ncbi:MAG: DegT/DnrJ/EryC1/StrS family aminotransferase [Pseudonocardiaceae bacterium]
MGFKVPFLNLADEVSDLMVELHDVFTAVIESGCFLNGPQLRQLERELAQRCGSSYAIGVGSGTQALQILLLAHGVGPGDDVVTTAASFFATAKAIALIGARPVFADVCSDDYNLDVDAVRSAITPRTKAILAVHLYGRPVDVSALGELAVQKGILLLEDGAHALGAAVDARPVGSLGDGAALSFYPTKNLGAFGDAGAVVVNDPHVAELAHAARFLGSSGRRDEFNQEGISGRMDELQAALLLVRLRHFDQWQMTRAALVDRYRAMLPGHVLLPSPPPAVVDAHHLFVIRHRERDRIADDLVKAGIETQIHYRVPLHRQPVFGAHPPLPTTERWSKEVLSLPLNRALSFDAQESVIRAVIAAVG